jgi:tetratricopeptide (TPR) repeat protein
MSPELLRGDLATAKSDQFAFFRTLNECLAAHEGVPWGLRRVIERGLDPEAGARFSSMAEVAEALRKVLGQRTRGLQGLTAAIAVTALAILAYQATHAGQLHCEEPSSEVAALWNPNRVAQIEAVFQQSDAPFLDDSWRRTRNGLDVYLGKWEKGRREACLSAGESPGAAQRYHLQMACYERTLGEVAALLDVLSEPTSAGLANLATVADDLPSVESCSDPEGNFQFADVNRSIEDAQARELRAVLARIKALRHSGRYQSVRVETEALLTQFSPLAPSGLEAEALVILGTVLSRMGEAEASYARYSEALEVAETVGDNRSRAQALRGLAFSGGSLLEDYDRGVQWATLAVALARRLGDDRLLDDALSSAAGVHRAHEAREQSLAFTEQAIAAWERAGHPNRAIGDYNRGTDLRALGRFPEARMALERARAAILSMHGPDHPLFGAVVGSIGTLHSQMGEYEEGLVNLAEGLRIREATFGQSAPVLAPFLHSIGSTKVNMGAPAEAIPEYERCIEVDGGEQLTGYCHYGLGQALRELGQLERAMGHLAEAHDRVSEQHPGPVLAEIRFAYATALWESGTDRARGRSLAQSALKLYRLAPKNASDEIERVERWLATTAGEL